MTRRIHQRESRVEPANGPKPQGDRCPTCGGELQFVPEPLGIGRTIEQCEHWQRCGHWRALERVSDQLPTLTQAAAAAAPVRRRGAETSGDALVSAALPTTREQRRSVAQLMEATRLSKSGVRAALRVLRAASQLQAAPLDGRAGTKLGRPTLGYWRVD